MFAAIVTVTDTLTSGPLRWLIALLECSFSRDPLTQLLALFMSLLKYHLLSEAFLLPSVQFQNPFQLKSPHTITGPLFTDLAFPLCMYVCLTYHTFYLLTLIFVCLHHYEYKLHVVRDFRFFFSPC